MNLWGKLPTFRIYDDGIRKLTVSEIAAAYNSVKHNLAAQEVKHCCNGTSRLLVFNEMVVLRQMLEKLGFDGDQIEKHLHDVQIREGS